ncbi:TPA: hypothetical protein ACH3X1_002195 [Trebouxia sp. C0004]
MNDDRPIDIDQVGSDDSSMASGSSSGKKRAEAPAKYVWQYFKRYKDPLGKEVKRNNRYHQVCLGCQTCLKSCEVVTAEDHLLKCTSAIQRFTGLRDIILNQRAKEPTKKDEKAEGASSLRKTWLNRIYAQTISELKGLLLTVVFPQTVTLVFDGWTNIHYESVWIFIALLPVGALILKTVNASADSHTADFIAAQVEDLFQDFDHTRFGAIVSDNGGGCQNARKLVVKNHKHMVEKRDSSLADCFRYFIFLARTLKAAEENTVIDSGFVAWAYMAFNERYKDMADPTTRLALFLHPGYRLVGTQDKEFEALQLAAGELAKKRDYGSGKVRNMWKNMEQYRANHEPFEHGFKQGETPEMLWRLVASRLPVEADGSPATITLIARILLSIVPHAAAPEQAFSHMGRTHSDLCNRFKEGTVSMMANINQYFTVQPPAEE